jgi:glycosyltransferase involved in cell wall biosynthesis
MKIIHLSSSDISGGAARASYRIHKALLNEGYESNMIVNYKYSKDKKILGPKGKFKIFLIKLRPRIANLILKFLKSVNDNPHSISVLPSNLVNKINTSDADIVHLHWINHEMLSISDIAKIKKPVLWTLHDMWAFCGAEHLPNNDRWQNGYTKNNRPNNESGFDLNRWTWLRKLKHWKNPIQIITPSRWLANCVNVSKIMHDWPVSVIPNMIDTSIWKPSDKIKARIKFGIPSNISLIVFGTNGANMSHNKGFDLLIKTLKIIKKNGNLRNIELAIFGKHDSRDDHNIDFPIHYIGHLNNDYNLVDLYSAADVVLIPSRIESFCQIASESHACGTPVAAFDVGGLKDIIDHYKTGYLAKSYDTNDLAEGLIWILDKKNQTDFKQACIKKVNDEFSQKKIVREYLNIYKKILKS